MKTTHELYGIDPKTLRFMPYGEALEAKVIGAEESMKKYSFKAKAFIKNEKKYKCFTSKYEASKDAKNHTLKLLKELD